MSLKIFIIGITGTLGHKIGQKLEKNKKFHVYGTYTNFKKLNKLSKILNRTKFLKFSKINQILNYLRYNRFDYVINCAGVIKQKKTTKKNFFLINSILPKKISSLSGKYNFKFIHFSTDCVFDGIKGNYSEKDLPNAKDLYGLSKIKGEPKTIYKNCLTLRTSFIGHELDDNKSLLNWFLFNKRKEIFGYNKAFFSGPTNLEISSIVDKILKRRKFINGKFNLSGKKISKFELLKKINKTYKLRKEIIKKNKPKINRVLINAKFNKKFNYKEKNWGYLINQLYKDYLKNKQVYNIK